MANEKQRNLANCRLAHELSPFFLGPLDAVRVESVKGFCRAAEHGELRESLASDSGFCSFALCPPCQSQTKRDYRQFLAFQEVLISLELLQEAKRRLASRCRPSLSVEEIFRIPRPTCPARRLRSTLCTTVEARRTPSRGAVGTDQ